MTEQESKEKIVEIVYKTVVFQEAKEFFGANYQILSKNIADALIAAEIGDVSEWKHRAKRAEKTMIRLAEKYVDAAKINTIKDVNGKIYFAERQVCVTYVATMEMLESEKELAEERKDD